MLPTFKVKQTVSLFYRKRKGFEGKPWFPLFPYRANPDNLRPKPKPAPFLADSPMLGAAKSRTEKMHAPLNAKMTTSSTFNAFFGTTTAQMEMAKPKIKYFITLLVNSGKSIIPFILIYILDEQKQFGLQQFGSKVT